MRAAAAAVTAAVGLSLMLSGCAPRPGAEDAAALARLAEVAGPTSGVAPERISRTECWLPSEHLIGAEAPTPTTWKVLCRVHWSADDGAARFQDTTCIGDFAAEPMLERCYRWTHYDLMPVFEDHPGVPAD